MGEQPSVGGSHRRPDDEPEPRRVRWEPSRSAIVAAVVLVLVVLLVTLWWYQSSRAPAVPITASGTAAPAGSTSAPSPTAVPSTATEIVVDVAGKVVHPGVYRLAPGSRVDDAVRAAGGAVPGVSTVSLNLAAPLHDGDEVVVGVAGVAGNPIAAAASGTTSGLVDLNSATADQLDALPGVGPVLAQHIIEWRTAHGGFTSVSQLQNVSGIGDSKFADLKALVTA